MTNMLYATLTEGFFSFMYSLIIVMPVQGVFYFSGLIDTYSIEPVIYVCAMFALFDMGVSLYHTHIDLSEEEEE